MKKITTFEKKDRSFIMTENEPTNNRMMKTKSSTHTHHFGFGVLDLATPVSDLHAVAQCALLDLCVLGLPAGGVATQQRVLLLEFGATLRQLCQRRETGES
jgi:hypothetical protein